MKIGRLQATEGAKIYKSWNEYADVINSGNMEQWSSLWSNDSSQLPPDAPQQFGKDQIGKLAQAHSDQYHSILSINPEVVRKLGDQAYTYVSFTTEMIFKEGKGKTKTPKKGKFLTVLRKKIDGSWKIMVDCFNYKTAM